ncbi:hypothetical protein [Naasia aerilata]|uniref:Uncharacterized protein n=1 Tax=Naasia aerilata TaxID=1162966 RepID=A0ABM8GH18_9MICO|nr:hypothetical protein [Naasia aerilata]BDZ47663.1 hypothetical protein GCM10025866_35720 [Naasia aerilata]
MDEQRTGGEPDENEQTTPSHEQQVEEQAQAESENGYNDPIGGLPIA